MLHRRRLLALAGSTVALTVAGCAEQKAEFLVTDVRRIHQVGSDRYDYPEDILYRVSIENTGPDRENGRVELTLTHDIGDDETETWSKTEDISLSRGTATRRVYVFENVYDEGNDIESYTLAAEIVQDDR